MTAAADLAFRLAVDVLASTPRDDSDPLRNILIDTARRFCERENHPVSVPRNGASNHV